MKTLEVMEKVLKGKRLKPVTRRHYREALGSLSRYESEWPVRGVVINEWLVSLGDKYSDATIKMWFDFVNAAGKYVQKVCKVENPCEGAVRPKVSKKRRRYFTAYEIVSIIKACETEFEKVLIFTFIDSTCRVGEIGANRKGEGGLLGKNVGEACINVKGKTGERRYRLDGVVCDRMREMAGGDDEPIFRGKDGKAASVGALQHRIRRVIRRAGITGNKLGPHTLRHSSASLVAKETGSALAVKALLQHDNIDTSMGYIHDAEDVIQQRISPLRLVAEQVFREGGLGVGEMTKQLTMGGEIVDVEVGEFEKVESKVSEGVLDLLDEQFREIRDDMVVHSRLKADDLRLIRKAFMGYIRSGDVGSDEASLRYLFRRMLRKVK